MNSLIVDHVYIAGKYGEKIAFSPIQLSTKKGGR
jgi:hypothetical protein